MNRGAFHDVSERVSSNELLRQKISTVSFVLASSETDPVVCFFGINKNTSEIFLMEARKEELNKLVVVSRFKKFVASEQIFHLMSTWHQNQPGYPWKELKRPLGSGPPWSGARKKLMESTFEFRN